MNIERDLREAIALVGWETSDETAKRVAAIEVALERERATIRRLRREKAALRRALGTAREAIRTNLVYASRKDEPALLAAFHAAEHALTPKRPKPARRKR